MLQQQGRGRRVCLDGGRVAGLQGWLSPEPSLRDGVVAEQGGGDARGRCRVLVGG